MSQGIPGPATASGKGLSIANINDHGSAWLYNGWHECGERKICLVDVTYWASKSGHDRSCEVLWMEEQF